MDIAGRNLRVAELAVINNGSFRKKIKDKLIFKFDSKAAALVFACCVLSEKLCKIVNVDALQVTLINN